MEDYGLSSRFDWLKALRVCLGFGGNLVSIKSEKEMEFVSNLSSQGNAGHAWIGLVYWSQGGGYLWSDGLSFNSSVFANWISDKPSYRKIHCAELSGNGWNFTNCGCKQNQHYICKRPNGMLL